MYGWNVIFLDDDEPTNQNKGKKSKTPGQKTVEPRPIGDAARQGASGNTDRRNSPASKPDQDSHDASTPFVGLTMLLNWLVFVA